MDGRSDGTNATGRLQIHILFATDHSDTRPAPGLSVGQPNEVPLATIWDETNAGLGVVLVHGLAEKRQILLA